MQLILHVDVFFTFSGIDAQVIKPGEKIIDLLLGRIFIMRKQFDSLLHLFPELMIRELSTAYTQYGISFRKRSVHIEIKYGGNQFPVREVAGGTENDQCLVSCFLHFYAFVWIALNKDKMKKLIA